MEYRLRLYSATPDRLADLINRLPAGSKIEAISPHAFFSTNEYAVRVSNPEFPVIQSGYTIPLNVWDEVPKSEEVTLDSELKARII